MHKKLLTIGLILTSILFADLGNLNSYVFIGDTLTIFNDRSDIIKIVPVQDNVLNIRILPNGNQDSMTLVLRDYQKTGQAQLNDNGDELIFSTNKMVLEIKKSPLKMNLSTDKGLVFDNSSVSGFSDNNFTLGIGNNDYYGLHNRNQGDLNNPPDGEIHAGDQGEAGAPFVWTPQGWGMLVDTYGGQINLNSSTLNYDHDQTTGQDLNVYFISGQPFEIFQGMTYISGRSPLFPKFTYGFLNTEWGIDQQELLNDIRRYRKEEIPIDAYILDYDWMAYGQDNYGEFRWDQEKFPGGASGTLQDSLENYGLKLMGIRKPRIRVNSVQGQYCQNNDLFVDYVNDYFTGQEVGRLDFRKKQARDWYWNSFWDNGAFQKGLIGYWNDEADVYGGNLMFMQMQRSQYEGQRRDADQRVWSINRNFFLGSQRYAYAHWSGDIGTSFQSMAEQRLFMLSSIVLGSSWWSMDIGGFQGTPSPENYIRWIQFGAFVPVFRVHGTNGQEREPWNYGPQAVEISRKYINMRYALMPYIYTQAYQNYKEGRPFVRPLVMDYPDDLQVRNMYSEWMFGDNFLVRPIVSENADQVNVYLPEGEWIDYNRGHRYSGSQYINYSVTLDDIPVFVKSGSVIPMKEPGDYVNDPTSKQALYWHIFPGPTDYFTLYEDNGWDYIYEGRGYSLTQASQHTNPEEITFNLNDRTPSYDPPDRDLFAVFRLITAEPQKVELDGEILQQRDLDSLENYSRGWAFQKTKSQVLVKFPDDGLNHQVVLTKGEDTSPPAVDTVSVLDQNSIQLVFDEAVQTDQAESIDSYS
ncbi:MAG TPA: TIM-barrel domain-containing protein, partial [bacterium]|nr:TIM-barrel domain-containing protein [bacterium]